MKWIQSESENKLPLRKMWLLRIDLVLQIAKHLEPDGNFTE